MASEVQQLKAEIYDLVKENTLLRNTVINIAKKLNIDITSKPLDVEELVALVPDVKKPA